MQQSTLTRRVLTATALLTGITLAVPATASAASGRTPHRSPLFTLVELSAQRLATADVVAAAKWGTGSPTDDPVREKQVLDWVAVQAGQLGSDPVAAQRVFQDQMDANKIVQTGLNDQWKADPSTVPAHRASLNEVREEINRINGALVKALAESTRDRSSRRCHDRLSRQVEHVRRGQHLDRLHTAALSHALTSVCSR
ncbi:chorismate mutase [Streptomyces sp. NPDC001262]|uniref:chorismate mutase n=1 Tax=Streptomyces sp. NPDC001262 TaxID=3364552 RepID=UPI0036A39D87